MQFGGDMKSQSVTTQMKAIKQYFPVLLFVMLYMLYKVVLTVDAGNAEVRPIK